MTETSNGYSPRPGVNGSSSPRYDSPKTPDRDRTDPLSAHIAARTNPDTEAPSFTRNISELGDLVISKFKDDETQPASDGEKDKRKRVSFFAKLRGSKQHEYFETPDEVSRTEGAQACTFSCHAADHPAYIRVRSHNKSKRDFNNLFLAQEFRHLGAIWSMKFSHDGRYLATGGQDMVVRVWKVLATPDDRQGVELKAPVFMEKPYREYSGHTADVLDLSWSQNNFLLSSSMDKTVRLWHVTREECLCCFQHSDFVTSIAFHPKDDRFFLSGSLDCKLRLWNIAEKKVAYWNELPELITAVAFDPMGRVAIVGTSTGLCLFYEAEGLRYHTQILVRSSRGRNAKGSKITGIQAYSSNPDSPHSDTKLLITSNDSRTRLYNMRDKSLVTKFKGNQNTSSQIRASFSEQCRYVISGSEDKQVYIWNSRPRLTEYKADFGYEHFEAHTDIVSATCFAPDLSRELLAASKDPIYEFVNTDDTKHDPTDGNIIVCADYSGCIKVFRQDSAATLRHKIEERSETASNVSKPARKSSIKSAISEESVKRPPQPISPARRPKQKKTPVKKEPEPEEDENPFMNKAGESFAFYDVNARPATARFDTSTSWKSEDTGLKCEKCGSSSFGASKGADVVLKCTNCHHVISP